MVADGLAFSEELRLILPTEAKSGENVDEAQARKYSAMTPEDVARQHTLPFDFRDATVEPMYVCLEKGLARVRLGLRAIGVNWAVLVVGVERVRLETPVASRLVPFETPVPQGPPPPIIPLDAMSPEEEFREILLPEVIAAAVRREDVVPIDSLLTRAIPFWRLYGRRARQQIRDKAANVFRSLAQGEFRGVLRVERGGSTLEGEIVRIISSPAGFDPRGQTQGWQKLRRKAERVLRGRASPPLAEQLTFEDLAREAEKGEK